MGPFIRVSVLVCRNTHSVGGRPLHRDRSPSCRVIFTKASWNKESLDSFWFSDQRKRSCFLCFDSPECRWSGSAFCTSWSNWLCSDTRRRDPAARYSTGSTSLWDREDRVSARRGRGHQTTSVMWLRLCLLWLIFSEPLSQNIDWKYKERLKINTSSKSEHETSHGAKKTDFTKHNVFTVHQHVRLKVKQTFTVTAVLTRDDTNRCQYSSVFC